MVQTYIIKESLDGWEKSQAIRELIANAFDEQVITKTRDVEVVRAGYNEWHIRDYGRGIKEENFHSTMNEEKLKTPGVVGRFGIGLLDSLTVLAKSGAKAQIQSKYGVWTTRRATKRPDKTWELELECEPPRSERFVGTVVKINRIDVHDVDKAQTWFLKFSPKVLLDKNEYGEIYTEEAEMSTVYIHGVKLATEASFRYSYNITKVEGDLRDALLDIEHEVVKSDYTEAIKNIILNAYSYPVISTLSNGMNEINKPGCVEEMTWTDVVLHIAKQMQIAQGSLYYFTEDEYQEHEELVEIVREQKGTIRVLPDNIVKSMMTYNVTADPKEGKFNTCKKLLHDMGDDFAVEEVLPETLSEKEMKVYLMTDNLLSLIRSKIPQVRHVKITDKLVNHTKHMDVTSQWDTRNGIIWIRRSQLESASTYTSSLLRECMHSMRNDQDMSMGIELMMNNTLAYLALELYKERFG